MLTYTHQELYFNSFYKNILISSTEKKTSINFCLGFIVTIYNIIHTIKYYNRKITVKNVFENK